MARDRGMAQTAGMPDDLAAAVRPLFPALARYAAFLDGPGGSQLPASAIDAMAAYLRGGTANDGGVFATSRETVALLASARAAAADLTCSDPGAIAFGPNMTTLNFLLAHAVARLFEPGDEIVVTQLDHDANVAPWLAVARDHGLVVRTAPIRVDDATLDLDALAGMIGDRTRVVAFTLASNATGSLTPARQIAALAHDAGALAWADAVHFAPHRRPDRRGLDLDVLLCSPYKLFGPHLGIAALRPDLAASLPADRVRPASEDPPGHRFETGTPSFEALAGFVASMAYLSGLGDGDLDAAYARIRSYEDSVSRYALERLLGVDGLRLYGIADVDRVGERTPTFCFTLRGEPPRETNARLAAAGVFAWDGNYYAQELFSALGVGGAVRAGFLHYNTVAEVDRLVAALVA